ncbi:hypothetical protein HYC85_009185 [Camellia sinensis]|uniref:Uncharacterized protein n=1 Tax=Camellia sinensis TaxID=4442 RepID=A0A7J7HGB1_CAMSI|nr:hypothetical protein HYC85_009185 [Camellia sinensis]
MATAALFDLSPSILHHHILCRRSEQHSLCRRSEQHSLCPSSAVDFDITPSSVAAPLLSGLRRSSGMPVHGSMVPVQVEGSDEQYQQSLLRSRFLQSRRLVQDKRPSSSVAASELGFLRQRHTQWFKVFGFNAISTIRVASFFLFLRNIFPALTTMQGCFYYLPYLGVCVSLCGGLFSYS